MCLENILLWFCENIKYLPRGLDKLHRLQEIVIINCPNVVCFPESGLPTTPNLKSLTLCRCEKLEALPSLHSLQLERLSIKECPRVESIPQGSDGLCLPTTLSELSIDFNFGKVVMQRGELHTLVSLRDLSINGSNCTDTVSFPEITKLCAFFSCQPSDRKIRKSKKAILQRLSKPHLSRKIEHPELSKPEIPSQGNASFAFATIYS